jgi:hypothetical protein
LPCAPTVGGSQAQTAKTVIEFVGPVVLGTVATILVKLEECADRCQARHRGGFAPGRFSLVLALEISQASRAASDYLGDPRTHRPSAERKQWLGCSQNPWRITEARIPHLGANCCWYLRAIHRRGGPKRSWLMLLNNHRELIVALDFFTVATITFQLLYCFFVIDHQRRKILHCNVTAHPTGNWVIQQLRETFRRGAVSLRHSG